MPTIFVSHGAPSLLIDQDPTFDFLKKLGGLIPHAKAILCVSAHWESARPSVTGNPQPDTIHDYYGFAKELYEIQYSCPGDHKLAQTVQEMLIESGLDCNIDESRGIDHGAWVPLKLIYPSADIPVVQLSVQTALGANHHFKIGHVLQPLRDQGVLILGSGGATHNLREFGRFSIDAPGEAYAKDFDLWLCQSIQMADEENILEYRHKGPYVARNHPTDEHILPLFVPLGAGGAGTKGKRLHQGFTYGILSMAAYAWGV